MSWLAPAWLLGLALLPILWWLHRVTSRGRTLRVASLLHWPERPTGSAVTQSGVRRVDATWLLRAAALALLAIGLAGPEVALRAPPLVVWIDSSASLGTVEDGVRRIDRALAELTRRVQARGTVELEVRSLGDPAFAIRAAPPFAGLAERLPAGAPMLPERVVLDSRSEHWVVTDGATVAVNVWIAQMPIAAVVAVGVASENVALIELAARPALGRQDRLDVEIGVFNSGRAPAQRRVSLAAGGQERWSTSLALPPGASATLRAGLERITLPLVARLTPGDALAADDTLELFVTRSLIVPVTVDARCGAALRAALAAHPRLTSAGPGRPAELAVECRDGVARTAASVLRVHGTGVPRLLAEPPTWTEQALALDPPPLGAALRVRSPLAPERPGDRRLLAAAGEPLLLRRASPAGLIETNLDLDDPALTAQSSFPLLVRLLVDAALERRLLLELASVRRTAAAANIAPRVRWPARLAGAPRAAGTTLAVGPWALLIALALVLLDTAAGVATLARDIRYYRGEEP